MACESIKFPGIQIAKRIVDANTAQYCAMLKSSLQIVRARQTRRVNDHRIPKGNSIQPMQLDGRYHIFHKANNRPA